MLRSSPLIDWAYQYAHAAHGEIDHRRKYTNEPYFVHPYRVALRMQEAGGTDMQIVWALMHDTDEDTLRKLAHTQADAADRFGDEVAEEVALGIYYLSDQTTLDDGPRHIRKVIDKAHNAAAPARVKSVKLCDNLDNGYDIWLNDPAFAVVYFREINDGLTGLLDADIPDLVTQVQHMIGQYYLDPNRQKSTKRPG